MESNHNGKSAGDLTLVNKSGVWVVAATPGNKYLGRVQELDGKTVSKEGPSKQEVLTAKILGLKPCFDFIAPIRPVQGPDGRIRMEQTPIVKTFDFSLEEAICYVKDPGSLYFLKDLSELDIQPYWDFVLSATRSAEAAVVDRRTQIAGITRPPSGLVLPRG